MAWHFAYGKPAQAIQVSGHGVSLAAIIAGRVSADLGDDDDQEHEH